MRQVNEFFYDKHLFKSLDYSTHGTTYEQSGIITAEIEAYTKEADRHIDTISQLAVDFGSKNIRVASALAQINAEEDNQLSFNMKEVLTALTKLSKTEWQDINDMTILDGRKTRRSYKPIYVTNQPQEKRAIRLEYTLSEPIDTVSAPLFNTLARFLLFTIVDRLCYTYGCYADHLNGMAQPLTVSCDCEIIPYLAQRLAITDIIETIRETVRYIMEDKAVIQRIFHDLSSVDYHTQMCLAPDFERLIPETRTIVGAKGWNETITPELIESVFRQMSLAVTFKRKHYTVL